MTLTGRPQAGGEEGSSSPSAAPAQVATAPAPSVDEVPQRADGVELLGEMAGSGYRVPPALARRRDGQVLQLTPLLYLVLDAIDGERDYAAIGQHVTAQAGKALDADGARTLVDGQLRPLGLARRADGTEPEVRKANPLLALRFRLVVSNPEVTRRITAPFAVLFNPIVVAAMTAAFAAICWWVLFVHGLAYAANQAFARPGLILAIFLITLVSAGFHEFGHASAARYGGATPGVMGAGLYLVWPAFYTDVTDSYRLGRRGRLRTDLGGLYFNAVLCVAIFGLWAATKWDALLLVIATQLIQMIRQLPPLLRFDGYHVVADLSGVPDLFHQIKPTLLSLLPTRWNRPESKVLKPWAKAVVSLWVIVVVPLMLLTVVLTVVSLPRILATAAAGVAKQWDQMNHAFGSGETLTGLTKILGLIAVGLPILGVSYMMARTTRQIFQGAARATAGHPVRRAGVLLVGVVVVVGLAFAWWPRGNYRQVQPNERGTIQDAVPVILHPARIAGSPSPRATPSPAAGTSTATPATSPSQPSTQGSSGANQPGSAPGANPTDGGAATSPAPASGSASSGASPPPTDATSGP